MIQALKEYYHIIINVLIAIFIVFIITIMIFMQNEFNNITKINIASLECLQDISNNMKNIDNDVLSAINVLTNNPTSNISEYIDKIDNNRNSCKVALEAYSKLNLSEIEKTRYNQFRIKFLTYEKNIDNLIKAIEQRNTSEASSVYIQELTPLKNCTTELLDSSTYLAQVSADSKILKVKTNSFIIITLTGVFGVFIIVIINILKVITLKDKKLIAEKTRVVDNTKKSLNTAVFTDVLTGANNRISFLEDFYEKIKLEYGEAGYLIMFNINEFDYVNITFGNSVGDIVLEESVKRLKDMFPDNKIYRTGSDEFVVFCKVDNSIQSQNRMINTANTALYQLQLPFKISCVELNIKYSVSMVRKTGQAVLNSQMLESCKEAMNVGRRTSSPTVNFVDLDGLV